MTETEVLQILRGHFEASFPKTCNNCGRQFATLREYILNTDRRGQARSYDADLEDWEPPEPLGSQALATCQCGTTLALGTDGMAHTQRLALLSWVKSETQSRGVDSTELLEHLRDQLRRQILDEGPPR
ncbi:MAG TPA: hypothetical protein VNX15_13480 [Gemmatimonadales bacterium]|jgi:hypothetical protein|nr:hypothetical protein [Gemmatimonadales bacterium]